MRIPALRWLVCGLLCWHAGAAALTAEDLQALAGDDYASKEQALGALATDPDPRAAALLQALSDGDAAVDAAGRIIIGSGAASADALAGMPVSEGEAAAAEPIMLNNRLRSLVERGIAARRLFDQDLAQRRAAAEALLANPDARFRPLVERARMTEADPDIKSRLDALWAMSALNDPDPEVQLAAIDLVVARRQPELRDLLRPLAEPSGGHETDARVRAAARAGIASLDRWQWWGDLAATLFSGLSLGSVLLLAALGLAITYGLIGVINMAHGEFLMLGAYATYVVQQAVQRYAPGWFDWYPLLSVPAAFAVAALAGLLIERLVLRHLYGRPLETLLTTFGLSLLMIQAVRMIFGAQNVQVANPGWMTGGIAILPGLILPYNRLIILAFSLAVVALAWAVLNRTRLGLFVRAVTQNRDMAACVGVKTRKVDSYAFGFGAGVAGLGGCALAQIGNVGPDLGQGYIIDSFMAVVLGGVGQLAGTVVGALGLGMASKLIEPFWGAVLAKIAVLVLIVLFIQKRPQGIFALKGRSAEA
ncbi:urea ABC transporter permease subunit UrtB [Pigmentiphaga sp.]|uniref:urea ABC transporter permease subunit UrtB n=1 Tax=Pigmentiphaga sp. TaxID=1977564 RepID=UPI0025D0E76F|nr:urea ABC transporter permease subunit UrtB [Pigmentiphaga sp.]MBX6317370.1 urea ABC transporter permease subunit UrtB [Pigmentiphaga sp.]